MRGCITSGEQWVFFIYEKRDNDKGHVSASVEYAIGPQCGGLGLILGLLHDWVCDSQSKCWHLGITILQANNTTTAQQVFFTTE